MTIFEAVMGVITAVIGIAGVLVGHKVLTLAEEKKALQDFWLNHAVMEGTVPLLNYLGNLHQRVGLAYNISVDPREGAWDKHEKNYPQKIDVVPVPWVAVYQILHLTGCYEIAHIIYEAEWEMELVKDPERMKIVNHRVTHLLNFIVHIHSLFTVSTVKYRGQVVFTSGAEGVKEAVDLFRVQVIKEKELQRDDFSHLNALKIFNIFDDKSAREKLAKKFITVK